MKKVLILCLIAVFLISAAGCARKSEYDKLFDEKEALVKKMDSIMSDKADLSKTISARDMEIRDLKNQIKSANGKLDSLQKELAVQTQK